MVVPAITVATTKILITVVVAMAYGVFAKKGKIRLEKISIVEVKKDEERR